MISLRLTHNLDLKIEKLVDLIERIARFHLHLCFQCVGMPYISSGCCFCSP